MFQIKLAIKTTDWYLPEKTAGVVLPQNVSWDTSKTSFENTSIRALSFDR